MAQVSVILAALPAGVLLLTPGEHRAASARVAGRDGAHRSALAPLSEMSFAELCGDRIAMKASARAVVIGGGVVGASVLYHLAKIGWTDVLLLEKSELTSGSTWHAAGGMHTFNGEANISRLQKYTIDLYREIEALSGQSCGLHPNGGLMLAATPGELDSLKLICSRARYLGMETEMISLEQALEFNPLIDPAHFIGALWRADGGHCDPSGTTQAYVKAARKLGAARRALHARAVAHAAPRRHLGRAHRQGHGARRARRQLRGTVGARGRPPGRHRAAGARDGAPLPHHRGSAGAQGPRAGDRQHHRLPRARSTCARSAAGR